MSTDMLFSGCTLSQTSRCCSWVGAVDKLKQTDIRDINRYGRERARERERDGDTERDEYR